MIDLTFTLIFAAFAIPLIAVELYGVWRQKRGDTISENVWWVLRRWPVLKYFVGAFLIWLFVHFLWLGEIV